VIVVSVYSGQVAGWLHLIYYHFMFKKSIPISRRQEKGQQKSYANNCKQIDNQQKTPIDRGFSFKL